jgi:uncharacterized membrane protein
MELIVYTRPDCSACDALRAELAALHARYPHTLTERPAAPGEAAPRLEVGPYRLVDPISPAELQVTLGAAADRLAGEARVNASPALPEAARHWTGSDAFSLWIARHYMLVFNLFALIYVGLPFLAPVMMAAGWTAPAGLIYRGYGLVCHQLGYRSFYILGEQAVYPRAAAEVAGLETFAAATGLSEGSGAAEIMAARNFVGNPQLGWKVALCERDVAIYGAILLFGVLFVLSGKRLPPLAWPLWIILALVPIGLDGVSQLLSQPPLAFLPYRESTPTLRVLTGALFGFGTAWFGYPLVEETMLETRKLLAARQARLGGKGRARGAS